MTELATNVLTEGTKRQARLVLLCGLPASGKTTLARELADAYGAVRLIHGDVLGLAALDEPARSPRSVRNINESLVVTPHRGPRPRGRRSHEPVA